MFYTLSITARAGLGTSGTLQITAFASLRFKMPQILQVGTPEALGPTRQAIGTA